MKRCPTCNRTFSSPTLSFCTDDGTPLVPVAAPDDEATVVRPSAREDEPSASAGREIPGYQAPGSYVPPGYTGATPRRTWPWIAAVLVVFVIFAAIGIAAAIMIPKMLRAANSRPANLNVNNQRSDANANLDERNLNANSAADNSNANANSAADNSLDTTPPPANREEVLQQLRDLEQEWTVANINADKKKLDRILADDYVGSTADGKPQGKAEYLRTATRDTAIQKWNFEDLKLSLKADRAALNGTINLNVRNERGENEDLAFRFTDKFVWRDGRWQATGSEVKPVQE